MSIKLLMIDDEGETIEDIKGYLELKGFEVYTALRGDTGLELIKQHNPDVLLLDLHLKEGPRGMDTLREALKIKPDLKIAVLTGFGGYDDVKNKCLNMGAKIYLEKPIIPSKLKEALEQLASQ